MFDKKIVSFGEILYDIYDDGKRIGGAPFNFIYHIHNLSYDAAIISRVGTDQNGNDILDFLDSKKFPKDLIQSDDLHATGAVKVSLNDQKVPTFDILINQAYDYIKYTEEIEQVINNETGLLYFGTLAQRNKVSRETLHGLFDKNVKYFCDINLRQNFYSRDVLYHSLSNTNVLKINSDELKIVNELMMKQNFRLEETAMHLLRSFNIELMCITLGEDGAVLLTNTDKHSYSITPEKIVDTVGAGDAYAAILCLGYLEKWPIAKINKTANEFAADVCGIPGAIPEDDNFYTKYISEFKNE